MSAELIPFFQVVGTIFSAVSAVGQGRAQQQSSNYNATVATQNAQVARDTASQDAQQQQRDTYLRLGAIKAAQGKSGGDAAQGSVLDVIGDTAAQSELEKQNILYSGELQARGYTNTATLDRYQGQNAASAGNLKAGSELLGGMTNAYMSYSRLNRTS